MNDEESAKSMSKNTFDFLVKYVPQAARAEATIELLALLKSATDWATEACLDETRKAQFAIKEGFRQQ